MKYLLVEMNIKVAPVIDLTYQGAYVYMEEAFKALRKYQQMNPKAIYKILLVIE